MANIIKISDAGTLAFHAAVFLAHRNDRPCTAGEMAGRLRVSEAHLVKVLQRLARAGLVTASRGPKGGFRLAQPPGRITLLHVFEAIEGAFAPVECLLKQRVCSPNRCMLGRLIENINDQARRYLSTTTLASLVKTCRF